MKIFLYSSSVYSCHLFLICSVSVRSIAFLSFIVPIFAWNVPLVSLIFLKIFLVFPILLFSSISFHWSLRKSLLCLLAILWNRWHHPYGRNQRTKESLDESERGEWKSRLKTQHSKNKDHEIWSHHFMANRWGNNGNSDRFYFLKLQKSLQMVTASLKLKDA